jgi:DNA-directed RNA polymerase subunit RPC12/RpoP
MTNRGLCPKCGKRVLHVNVEHIVGLIDGESKARVMSYCCIHCNTVLGVALDARSKARSKNGVRSASASAAAKPGAGAG